MGIYIKGMEMPKSCYFCEMYEADLCWCSAAKRDIDSFDDYDNRSSFCPLVPVPPHGRLIDGTDLYAVLDGGFDVDLDELPETKDALLSMIQSAETIIPAEEGDA